VLRPEHIVFGHVLVYRFTVVTQTVESSFRLVFRNEQFDYVSLTKVRQCVGHTTVRAVSIVLYLLRDGGLVCQSSQDCCPVF